MSIHTYFTSSSLFAVHSYHMQELTEQNLDQIKF